MFTVKTAITITNETMEQTVLKMLKANIEEYNENSEKAVEKFMKLALELKSKARDFLQENKDEFLSYVEFSLRKEAK
jgi:ABC-type Zn uptake system ZnuABC Zn-binding protein ZnuA